MLELTVILCSHAIGVPHLPGSEAGYGSPSAELSNGCRQNYYSEKAMHQTKVWYNFFFFLNCNSKTKVKDNKNQM